MKIKSRFLMCCLLATLPFFLLSRPSYCVSDIPPVHYVLSVLDVLKAKDPSKLGLGNKNSVAHFPPSVAITYPTNGDMFTAPAIITINANATDSDGTISKVEFYNGSTLLNTDNTIPYSYDWMNVAAGTYTLTAKAYNNLNAVTTSTAITIVVNADLNPPSVNITSPTNNATFTAPANVTINANASDSDGTIAKVEYYNGATLLNTDNTAPYSFLWMNVAAGTYTLTAKAYDEFDAVTTSTAIRIVVNGASNLPPSVNITSPTNNATFTAPASVTINATATDSDGTISKVEFYNGSTLLNSDNVAPYSYAWTGVAAGTYTITAKAYDNLNAVTTSSPVTIVVGGNCLQDDYAELKKLYDATNGSNWTNKTNWLTNADISTWYGITLTADGCDVKNINLSNNNLVGTLPALTFGQLEVFDVSLNKITGVIPPLSTPKLINLYLYNNQMTGTIPNFNLPNLRYLWLSYNELTGTIPDFNLPNLIDIRLRYCQLSGNIPAFTNTQLNMASSVIWVSGNRFVFGDIANKSWLTISDLIYTPQQNIKLNKNGAMISVTTGVADNQQMFEWYKDGLLLTTNQNSTYQPTANGKYFCRAKHNTLTIAANANRNLILGTDTLDILVAGNIPPSVNITSPTNNATFTAPASVTINATATDSDGTISKVEFYNGSTLLHTANAAPYSYVWMGVAAGTYTLTAKAYDNLNAVTISSAITIIVNSVNALAVLKINDVQVGNNSIARIPVTVTKNLSALKGVQCFFKVNNPSLITFTGITSKKLGTALTLSVDTSKNTMGELGLIGFTLGNCTGAFMEGDTLFTIDARIKGTVGQMDSINFSGANKLVLCDGETAMLDFKGGKLTIANTSYKISGLVNQAISRKGINKVTVNGSSNAQVVATTETDVIGNYTIDVTNANTIVVKPSKTGLIRPKVDIDDITGMVDIILNNNQNPYQRISADWNCDNLIDISDILDAIDYILKGKLATRCTNDWYFVPTTTILTGSYPYSYTNEVSFSNLTENKTANYYGMMRGDVNGNVAPNAAAPPQIVLRGAKNIELYAPNKLIEVGKTYQIPIKAKNFQTIKNFQGVLNYDKDALTVQSIAKNATLSQQIFGINQDSVGKIALLWANFGQGGVTLLDKDSLITLTVVAKKTLSNLTSVLSLDTTATTLLPPKAANAVGDSLKLSFAIDLTSPITEGGQNVDYFKNFPNPANSIVHIEAQFKETESIDFKVFNAVGQVILSRKLSAKQVKETLDVSSFTGGIYQIVLQTASGRIARTMTVVK